MSEISTKKNQLSARRGHCTRELNKVKQLLINDPINVLDLTNTLKHLEVKHVLYQETFDELDCMLASAPDPDRDKIGDNFQRYDEEITELLTKAHKVRAEKEREITGQPNVVVPFSHNNQIKLPSVEPIKFNGELENWTTFWSNFEALVHNNQALSPSVKFTHLQRSLTGEAHEIVRHFPCDDASYSSAIRRLKEEYDNPRALEEKLIDKLIDLDPAKYTVLSLNSFVNTYESVITSIENTQPDFMKAECLIKRIVGRKLPKEVRAYLELKHKQIYFSLKEITEGIHDCIKKLRTHDEDENPESSSFEEKNLASRIGNKKVSKEVNAVSASKLKSNLPNKAKVSSTNRIEATVNSALSSDPSKASTKQNSKYPCKFCGTFSHSSINCTQYKTVKSRSDRFEEIGRCVRCGCKGHKKTECVVNVKPCKQCHEYHHYALCPKPTKSQVSTNNVVTASTGAFSVKTCIESCSVALPTATAKISSPSSELSERVFFDQGSQCTIISSNLARKLNLQPVRHQKIAVSGLLTDSELTEYAIVKLKVTIGNCQREVFAVVMDRAVASINVPGLAATHEMLQQKNLKLADHNIDQDLLTGIGLTVGADYYGDFVKYGMVKKYGINLAHTPGGYMIFGPLKQKQLLSAANVVSHRVTANLLVQEPLEPSCDHTESLNNVTKLWDLDVIGINPKARTPEEDMTLNKYIQSVQYKDGQYWVCLPWKPDHPHLPTNFRMALGQLHSLRKSLEEKSNLETYDALIRSQLEADFIEIVPNAVPKEGENHYLCHHAVKKESLTTPLRMVFNCSAKMGNNPSLNDCLLTGPTLTTKLGDSLLEFRTQKYGVIGDISKAFLRIGLQTCDRDVTRFLWYHDPHEQKSDLITYRFKSVLFGATCSPFLLEATLETHLRRSSSVYKDKIRKGFYVDNLQVVTSKVQELHSIYEEANTVMAQANMPLRMWVTNERSLTKRIKKDFPDQTSSSETNILGLNWHQNEDSLSVKSPDLQIRQTVSRRQLLSDVSATFDPLGLVTPVTIRGKMLMKEAWKLKTDWDSPLPMSFIDDWQTIQSELNRVSEVKFPRSVVNDEDCLLHVFCDASTFAYGACAYIVTNDSSELLTSKGRVTPIKGRSLPELELTALQVGTQLAHYVKESLKDVKFKSTYVWSDNEAALQWVRNDRSDTPYVKNRTAKIRDLSDGYIFQHVGTKENPADLLSRGVDIDMLTRNDIWFHGPSWLPNPSLWPSQRFNVISVQTITVQPYEYLFECSKFRSLSKILRITGYVLKFVERLYKGLGREVKFKDGLHYWLYSVQRDEFADEVQALNQGRPQKRSLVYNLGLYVDPQDKLIRCRGRIEKSSSTTAKHPILLSRKHHFSKCLITRTHAQILHGGTADTLAQLRENYWLPKGRQVVKQVLSKCHTCRYLMSRAYVYPGPPVLPECRVNLTAPFTTIGVDYSGSINISCNDQVTKFYFCIFTCASTRAIHLELARDMTAGTFLHLLRRFIARRSLPSLIISDNGRYFHSNADFLEKLQQEPAVKEFLQSRQIKWKFIPPRSPWMGGFYERLVAVVKQALRLALFRCHVTEDELHTLLAEVEQRVNNRPLTYIDDDVNNPIPLTPAHLLYGRRLESFPSIPTQDLDDPNYAEHCELNERYNRLNKILSHWENIWSKEYIASLREKFYGANPAHQKYSPSIDDVVIIVSEGNRAKWPLGRVTKIHPDENGIVRTVEVLTRGNRLLKTVNKLIPLESSLDKDLEEEDPINSDASQEIEDVPTNCALTDNRPKRGAAVRAEAQRLQLIADNQL